jgi:hypothetical protein
VPPHPAVQYPPDEDERGAVAMEGRVGPDSGLGTARAGGPGPADDQLAAYVDPAVRQAIQERYLDPIRALNDLSEILKDPTFLADPVGHPAVYADHGAAHAHDVARQLLQVIDVAHGRLIPRRSPARLRWMKSYGILLALLHDAGMIDPTPAGRASHPEWAARVVLGSGFDDILALIQAADAGGLSSRITTASREGALRDDPRTALREMLAMSYCHSKRKVPVALLDDLPWLRETMAAVAPPARFAWLAPETAGGAAIVEDVIDTIRALRCADALRQRGTALKTSGQYEIFVDQQSGNAVYAFRPDAEHLYLLEIPDPIALGEANLSSCQVEATGDLRISFHHGHFREAGATQRAANAAALVLDGIHGDAIESFDRGARATEGLTPASALHILIEEPDDGPAFAAQVQEELARLNPRAAERVRLVPSLSAATQLERERYRAAPEIDWDEDRRRDLLAKAARGGHPTERIDPDLAFRDVRVIHLRAGESLIQSGTPAGFVYIPLGSALRGRPIGGYADFVIGPFVLVGTTGVVRGGIRNSDIHATGDMSLLAIPRGVFLDHWHFTHDPAEFASLFRGEAPPLR